MKDKNNLQKYFQGKRQSQVYDSQRMLDLAYFSIIVGVVVFMVYEIIL